MSASKRIAPLSSQEVKFRFLGAILDPRPSLTPERDHRVDTFVARRAGIQQASRDTTISDSATAPKVSGSVALTS
jgi:hypothetical protein